MGEGGVRAPVLVAATDHSGERRAGTVRGQALPGARLPASPPGTTAAPATITPRARARARARSGDARAAARDSGNCGRNGRPPRRRSGSCLRRVRLRGWPWPREHQWAGGRGDGVRVCLQLKHWHTDRGRRRRKPTMRRNDQDEVLQVFVVPSENHGRALARWPFGCFGRPSRGQGRGNGHGRGHGCGHYRGHGRGMHASFGPTRGSSPLRVLPRNGSCISSMAARTATHGKRQSGSGHGQGWRGAPGV